MQDGLRNLVLSRNKLISLHSTDEPVEFQAVLDVARSTDRNVHDWTVTSGVQVYSPDVPKAAAVAGTDKPELAMQYLLRQKRPTLACFRGLAPFTSQPVVRRLIKDYVQQADGSRECLLLMDEDALHPRIQRLAIPWRPGLPDKDELVQLVKDTYRSIKREATTPVGSELRNFEFEALARISHTIECTKPPLRA